MSPYPSLALDSCLKFTYPLSQAHADILLKHLLDEPANEIVDLCCGWGELLMQVAHKTGMLSSGVDDDKAALERGRNEAIRRDLEIDFYEMKASDWMENADLAICIGNSYHQSGFQPMLRRLARVVPRGRILVGDLCWENEPSDEVMARLPLVPGLIDIIEKCHESDWEILHFSVADQRELDDFESAQRRGTRKWLIQNPNDPEARRIREQENERDLDYFKRYRGYLGFVYIVLGR